jgi:hypothetical protein
LLNATSTCSLGMSVAMWMGRVGSGIGAPCSDSAPVALSIRIAETWWLAPAGPMPEALSLVAA